MRSSTLHIYKLHTIIHVIRMLVSERLKNNPKLIRINVKQCILLLITVTIARRSDAIAICHEYVRI